MLPWMGQSGDKSDLGQLAAFHLRGLRPSYAHRTVISSRPFVAGGGGLAGVSWGSFQHHRRVSVSEPHIQVALLDGLDPFREAGLGDCWSSAPPSIPAVHLVVLRPCPCCGCVPALALTATWQQQDP